MYGYYGEIGHNSHDLFAPAKLSTSKFHSIREIPDGIRTT